MITDSHTHHPTASGAVISCSPETFEPQPGLLYSVGCHPWDIGATVDMAALVEAVRHPQTVAVGECGIDALHGRLDEQKRLFAEHIALSEAVCKPLIIHEVKSIEAVLQLHKTMRPRQMWVRHGFRGKPEQAAMYLRKGIYLSFGAQFNAQTVRTVPNDKILIETDDSDVSIETVAAAVAAARGITVEELLRLVRANASAVFKGQFTFCR